MTTLEAVIAEKKASVASLADHATSILEKLEFIYGTSRSDITFPINDSISAIHADHVALNKTKNPWAIAEHIGSIDNNLKRIADIITSFQPSQISSNASYTHIITTKADIDAFLQSCRHSAESSINSQIWAILRDKALSAQIDAIEQEYKKHSNAAPFYAHLITHVLNDEQTAGATRQQWQNALERAKTHAIAGESLTEAKTTVAWPLQRFGLYPAAQNLDPVGLAKHYWKSAGKVTSISAFVTLAKMKRVGVLEIHAVTASPVEYNVSALTAKAAPGTIFDMNAGIDAEMLAKFNTVRKHFKYDESGKIVDPPHIGFKTIRHSAGASTQYIIVRTIDGRRWDAMRTFASADILDRVVIERIMRGPSPRIDAYQKIKAADFAKFIMPTPPLDATGMTQTDTVKKTNKNLIQDLVNRITGRIIQYVDTSLLPLPTTPKGLEDAISNPKFVEIMTEEFLASYAEAGVDEKTPAYEVVGTFIADLDTNIILQFSRSIKLNMIELGPDAKIFRDYTGETLRTRLYNLFVDVIKKSVAGAIMTKENVYEKVLIKDHHLTILAQSLSKAEDGPEARP